MSYIEREALKDALYEADAITMKGIAIINQFPAADAVPVVRCKECKYKEQARVNKKGFLVCPASGMEITDNDYCSYGERREGEEGK